MNNLINNTYWNVWKKLSAVDVNEERGAEAVEWIAMVAVILIMLLALAPVFRRGGTSIGGEIVGQISTWIGKFN